MRKELLPCLRSFTSGLRVAEMVWKQGMLIKVSCSKTAGRLHTDTQEYPPEVATIKNLDDSWALLKTEDGQARYPADPCSEQSARCRCWVPGTWCQVSGARCLVPSARCLVLGARCQAVPCSEQLARLDCTGLRATWGPG